MTYTLDGYRPVGFMRVTEGHEPGAGAAWWIANGGLVGKIPEKKVDQTRVRARCPHCGEWHFPTLAGLKARCYVCTPCKTRYTVQFRKGYRRPRKESAGAA